MKVFVKNEASLSHVSNSGQTILRRVLFQKESSIERTCRKEEKLKLTLKIKMFWSLLTVSI